MKHLIYLPALLFVLSACGGTGSPTPATPPVTEAPRETSDEAAFGLEPGESGVKVTVHNGENLPTSAITPHAVERQLVAGIELDMQDAQLTRNGNTTTLTASFHNEMSDLALNSLSFEFSGTNHNGQSASTTQRFDGSVFAEGFLKPGDGQTITLELELPGDVSRYSLKASADVAEFWTVTTASTSTNSLGSQQASTPRFSIRNGSQLVTAVNSSANPGAVFYYPTARCIHPEEMTLPDTLRITKSLKINGKGCLALRTSSQFMTISDESNVVLRKLLIRGARGGIENSGNLTLEFVTVESFNGYILDNKKIAFAEGLSAVGVNPPIINQANAQLDILASDIQDNNLCRHILLNKGNAVLNDVSLSNIFCTEPALITNGSLELANMTFNSVLSDVAVISNHLERPEDNLVVRDSTFQDSSQAIYNQGTIKEIVNVDFLNGGNANKLGGAIYNDVAGTILLLSESKFDGNTARHGGAIYNEGAIESLSKNLFLNNQANRGVAIYTCGPSLSMTASLIYNNGFLRDTFQVGLGIYVSGNCAATSNLQAQQLGGAQLELDQVTIWNNNGVEGQYGTGIYLASGASAQVRNSIIAMNQGGSWFMSDVDADDPDSVRFDSAHSFYSVMDVFPPGSGDIASEDPSRPLDPKLSLNAEGLVIPSTNSLVIDAGDCPSTTETDIRGEARSTGENCDMGAVELNATELNAKTALEILEILPEYPGYNNQALISFDNQYLRIKGKTATNGLVSLRYSHNYAAFENYDLTKLTRDAGEFELAFNYLGLTDGALRDVADGLSMIIVEAEYSDGTVERIEQDFLVHVECLRTTTGACGGVLDYSSGTLPEYSSDLPDFVWWDFNTTSETSFTVTATIQPIRDGNHCGTLASGATCPLQRFSYRINNNPAVHFSEGDLRNIVNTDGSYTFTIELKELPKGRNGMVIGTVYTDVRVKNQVLHFDVQ